jgi:hypothetical protein
MQDMMKGRRPISEQTARMTGWTISSRGHDRAAAQNMDRQFDTLMQQGLG